MTRFSKTYKGEKKDIIIVATIRLKKCSKHYIPEKDLNELVLVIVNVYCNLMCSIKEFIEKVIMNKNFDYSYKLRK